MAPKEPDEVDDLLSKKSKNNPILMEARKVLLNRVTINDNDRFVTVDEFRFQMWGAADGEAPLRFWGIAHRERLYESKIDHRKVIYRAQKRMNTLGRGIDYKVDQEVAGCIVRTYVFYPVVLAFRETEDKKLQLEAYTPRWLTSGLAIAIVARKFDKVMEDLITRSESDKKGLIEKLHGFIENKKAAFRKKKEENKKKKKEKIDKKYDEKKIQEDIERAKRKAAGLETDGSDNYQEYDDVLSVDWSSDDE